MVNRSPDTRTHHTINWQCILHECNTAYE